MANLFVRPHRPTSKTWRFPTKDPTTRTRTRPTKMKTWTLSPLNADDGSSDRTSSDAQRASRSSRRFRKSQNSRNRSRRCCD